MNGLFLDASDGMDAVFRAVVRPDDPPVRVNVAMDILTADLPGLIADHQFILNDHTMLPTDALRACPRLKHVIFLGTGARSFMQPEELAAFGITVHTIKGYGDVAVAEHAIALMWAATRNIAFMDREIRAGRWTRCEGRQLTNKTLGLIGYGGIAAEVARIAIGGGMRVLAWNRSPKTAPGVQFVDLPQLLAESDIVSLHLLLDNSTHGFLTRRHLAGMRQGAILINTARAALVDEDAMIDALASGALAHAALDVFGEEPLPPGHRLATLPNVTLTAHSGFSTPEAREMLVRRALDIAQQLVK